MGSRFTQLVVDSADPVRVAEFWAQVLGTEIEETDEESAWLRPTSEHQPQLLFQKVPEGNTVKNRLHIDLNPTDREQDEEVRRLLDLGARHVDVGQGDVSWVVLVDPEGNEFCVLSDRTP